MRMDKLSVMISMPSVACVLHKGDNLVNNIQPADYNIR